jgi:Ion channel
MNHNSNTTIVSFGPTCDHALVLAAKNGDEQAFEVLATIASRVGPIRSVGLVVKSTVAIIVLHGLVILLCASFYRARCFPSWELAFYFSSSSYATVGYGDVVLKLEITSPKNSRF